MAIQLSGSLAITGSLVATGQIVAQTLNVQQVTSSIIYSCGSNIFGTSTSNTQTFTGSMFITGSNITANVGNACFGGSVCAPAATIGGQISVNAGNGNQLYLNNTGQRYTQITFDNNTSGASKAGLWWDNTTCFFEMYSSLNGGLRFYTGGDLTAAKVTLTSTGIACFACQVCAPVAIFSGCVGIGTTSPYQNLQVYQTGTAGNNYVEGTVQVGGTNTTLGAALSYAAQNSGYVNLVNLNTSGGANARISLGFGAISSGLPASTVMTLNQSGNVGIGCTTPGYALTIESSGVSMYLKSTSGTDSATYGNFQMYRGANKVGNGVGIALGLLNSVLVNTEYAYIGTLIESCTNAQECGAIGLYTTTAGTQRCERLRITSAGNVGIGTSSPSYRLVVNSGVEGISAGISGATYGIRFDNGGTFSSGMSTIHGVDSTLIGTYQPIMINGSDVRFGTSAAERMRITSGGLVSINQTSGYGVFNVTGIDSAWGEGIVMNPAPNGYSAINFRAEGRTGSCFIATWQLGKISSGETSSGEAFSLNRAGLTGGTAYRADASQQWKTNGDSIFGFKVGIGTTSPVAALQVVDSQRALAVYRISGTNRTTFYDNDFAVCNDGGGADGFIYGSNTGGSFPFNGYGEVIIQANPRTGYANGISFVTGTTSPTIKMRILEGGNVGIGTTSPGTKLDVWGTIRTTITSGFYADFTYTGTTYNFGVGEQTDNVDFKIAGGSGAGWTSGGNFRFFTQAGGATPAERMRITSTGQVGIGTTSTSAEANLFLGAQGSTEGGQLVLQKGTSCSCATHLDNFQDRFRIMSGTNTTSTTELFSISMNGGDATTYGRLSTIKQGGGGNYKQTVVGQTTAASSGTAKKIAYVGFTHSIRVYIWANQDTAHGSSAIADITTLYGSSNGGTVVESNFGNVTDIAVTYNNGGSPAYTIDVTLTYSGTAPTINYVIEGISWDNNIYTL